LAFSIKVGLGQKSSLISSKRR